MIYVECKPDFVLASLFVSKKGIIHAGNKSEVIKCLRKRNNCKGMIDEDPGHSQPSYLKEFNLVKESSNLGIKILRDKRNNYLIVLCPRLEEWILNSAKERKIDLEKDYRLPAEENKFHAVINANISKFELLIKDLRNKSLRFKKLRECFEIEN